MYRVEKYKNHARYDEQYNEIHQFLLAFCDSGFNEHFHWARFEWMIGHSLLEENKLDRLTVFKNQRGTVVVLVLFDTFYADRYYFVHNGDEQLVREMVAILIEQSDDRIPIKVNSNDWLLAKIVQEKNFKRIRLEDHVLQITLTDKRDYHVPDSYFISPKDFIYDKDSYQSVIHKGFEDEGEPVKGAQHYFMSSPHFNSELKVFAFDHLEYTAHCGIWYTEGETAYIEPVVTIPRCRQQGLAKAVVYESLNRSRELGAKRAIVLSSQPFYYQLGFTESSAFYLWEHSN